MFFGWGFFCSKNLRALLLFALKFVSSFSFVIDSAFLFTFYVWIIITISVFLCIKQSDANAVFLFGHNLIIKENYIDISNYKQINNKKIKMSTKNAEMRMRWWYAHSHSRLHSHKLQICAERLFSFLYNCFFFAAVRLFQFENVSRVTHVYTFTI